MKLITVLQCLSLSAIMALAACTSVAHLPGSDAAVADKLFEALGADVRAGKLKDIHSVLVYKDGALLYEDYFRGTNDYIDFEGGIKRVAGDELVMWHADRPHYVASVTKAVTAILAGIALNELGLDADAKVMDLLPPELAKDLEKKGPELTLRHLLTMTAGYRWDEWAGNDLVALWRSEDFARFVLSRENLGPDAEWRYNSALPNLVLRILEYQLAEPLSAWAHRHFFAPLGIINYRWDRQPTGTAEGSARLFLTPRDMLKIGMTVLHSGIWGGRQIIPATWVAEMTSLQAIPEGAGYGYYFWLRNVAGIPYISADGDGGQQINIFREHKMVVVLTQGNYGEWPLYMEQAKTIMGNYILPALAVTEPQP
ncbi:serine hydrolase domain-containing protein [Kordiimonas sp.]|uniref:serine hydrolase domain-containing protein n=1 Tax=Kordiimonas sp. TaxID=1970157 RepID=UPI003A8F693E